MDTGISVYVGLDNTFKENIDLIAMAPLNGVRRLFTSFHIPETNIDIFRKEIKETLHVAKISGMDIISDISPNTLALLGIDTLEPYMLKQMGITTVRMDFGFSPKEIAKMSFSGLKVQLNASTVTEEVLRGLERYSANFACIDALHNFYPRENTGLSEEFFDKKNRLLHEYGIKVGAFIPSYNRPRSPIQAGLPTLEEHRYSDVFFAARHMAALYVDSVFIGDSLPTDLEIYQIANIKPKQVTLSSYLMTEHLSIETAITQPYHVRLDEAADVYRIDGCRQYCSKNKVHVPQERNIPREVGAITIDNHLYGRYMGELQILKKPLPADKRVNVVALLPTQELTLMKYLTPGREVQIL